MSNGLKLWRRWDPRFEAMPLREARAFPQFCIEVVPDLFEPGAEQLRDTTLSAIGAIHDSIKGRFLVRTAHPGTALKALRDLSDTYGHGSDAHRQRDIPNRLVLAIYAETQAELDARVAELRTPRVLYEELALTDMDAAIALAQEEGAVSDYKMPEVLAAKAKGPEVLASYLKDIYRYSRTTGIPVDSGGLALYLSPREPLNIGRELQETRATIEACRKKGTYCDANGWHNVPPRPFDWVICAGMVGPIAAEPEGTTWEERTVLQRLHEAGREGATLASLIEKRNDDLRLKPAALRKAVRALQDRAVVAVRGKGRAAIYSFPKPGPHPLHPNWIADVATQARVAEVPFCVPTLGEWAPYSHLYWDGDRLCGGSMSSSDTLGYDRRGEMAPTAHVDYDPTWAWGTRGWDDKHLGAKPSEAYMQAVGSHLAGRELAGRIFDEWPPRWERR